MNYDDEIKRINEIRANLAAETQNVLREHQERETELQRQVQQNQQEMQSRLNQLGAEDHRQEGELRFVNRLKSEAESRRAAATIIDHPPVHPDPMDGTAPLEFRGPKVIEGEVNTQPAIEEKPVHQKPRTTGSKASPLKTRKPRSAAGN